MPDRAHKPSHASFNAMLRTHAMSLRRFCAANRWILIAFLILLGAASGCNRGPWTLWDAYSTRFIDGQGRVVDHTSGDRTTSEGQAYAMFFALANNDRAHFDKVLQWTQTNLAGGDMSTHLPVWLWGKTDKGDWKVVDQNPASDADVWMAYTLVEAGRLWNAPTYTNLGRKMMAMIAKSEVVDLPSFGLLLLPGPAGFQHGQVWTLNPSYMPLFVFQRLAVVDPAGPWEQIAQNIPRFLEQSARHGFAMDWVDYFPGDGFYPTTKQPTDNKATVSSGGSYDAIRVYLWAGMLDGGQTRARVLNALPAMSVYLGNHDAPPQMVNDQGIPLAQDGPVGFSAAMVPYLRAFPDLSRLSAKQTIRMSVQRDPTSGLYGKDGSYYDQNLALFETGYVQGRFRFGADGELNVEWTR
jgi:endoglucanase